MVGFVSSLLLFPKPKKRRPHDAHVPHTKIKFRIGTGN